MESTTVVSTVDTRTHLLLAKAGFNAMPSRKEIAKARKIAKEKFGVNFLLTIGTNPKLAKSDNLGVGILSAVLHLAPAMKSGYNACPWAKECIDPCLHTSGNPAYQSGKDAARIARTRFFFEDRYNFMIMLVAEIAKFESDCIQSGFDCAVRLNGTSDIVWERVAPWLFTLFSKITFYDYTKGLKRMMRDWTMPPNYSLTFSRQSSTESDCVSVLENNGNVAVVFRKSLPKQWKGFEVIDGTKDDLRFRDPKGVVVGLIALGKARTDKSGFVVDNQ